LLVDRRANCFLNQRVFSIFYVKLVVKNCRVSSEHLSNRLTVMFQSATNVFAVTVKAGMRGWHN